MNRLVTAVSMAQRIGVESYRLWYWMDEYDYDLEDIREVPVYKLNTLIEKHEPIE